jgi:hypothetical protein
MFCAVATVGVWPQAFFTNRLLQRETWGTGLVRLLGAKVTSIWLGNGFLTLVTKEAELEGITPRTQPF